MAWGMEDSGGRGKLCLQRDGGNRWSPAFRLSGWEAVPPPRIGVNFNGKADFRRGRREESSQLQRRFSRLLTSSPTGHGPKLTPMRHRGTGLQRESTRGKSQDVIGRAGRAEAVVDIDDGHS